MPIQPATTTLESSAPRRPRRRVIVRWIKRILLVVVALVIIGALLYAWLPKPVAVDVARARHMVLEVEVDEDGYTRVADRYVVSAPITGMLERIELDAGTQVARGQVIARIEPPRPALLDARSRREARARLAAAIANRERAATAIQRAKAARDAAVRDADRDRLLEQRQAISAEARERAELAEQLAIRDLAAAQLGKTAAAAEVEAARAAIEEQDGEQRAPVAVEVRSPSHGQLLRVVRDSAGPVVAGASLLEIGDPKNLEVVVDVLSSDATQIAPGMRVWLEGWGGSRALAGTVRRIEPSGFTRISALGVEEQRVRVIASIDEPSSLGDGFRVDARIITWRGRVLAIPLSALFRDHEQWAAYVATDGRAKLRHLILGHRGKLDVEVVSGIADGDLVIIHPGDRVAEGTRVTAHE